MVRPLALLFALVSPNLRATELYSWHSFEDQVVASEKFQLILHSRLRTRDALHDLQQVRFGPVARFTIYPKLVWFAGYYYEPGDNSRRIWRNEHRLFSGVEVPIHRGPVGITSRIAVERHFRSLAGDYNRYRSYLRVTWERRVVAPFLQNEWLAVADGFHSVRNSAGVRWRLPHHVSFEFGYLYDYRRADWGGDRQAIVTSVRFQRGEK